MKRAFLRGLLMNVGGSGSVAAVAVVRNVLIARVMGPAAFGVWQLCLVALRLAGESHLGALHAVARDAPVHRGAGREGEAGALERRGIAAALALSVVAGLGAGTVLRLEAGPGLLPAALLLAAAVVGQQWFLADSLLLRTRRRFGRLALLQATFAVLHLVGLVLLVPSRFVTGALLAWVLGSVGAVLLVRAVNREPLPLPSPAGLAGARATVGRGFTTYLVGVTFLLLLQVDRIAVGAFLGRIELGYLGILAVGGSLLLFLPDALAGVLWPFAGEHYGRHGEEPSSLGPAAVATVRGLSVLLAAVVLFALTGTEVLVGTDLVGREMRAYAPALHSLRWYLPGLYFLALVHPLRFLLVTAGAEAAVLRLQIAALVLVGTGDVLAATAGGDLRFVVLSGSVGGGLLFLGILRQAATTLRLGARAWRLAAEAALALAAAFLIDAGVRRVAPSLETLGGVLARLAPPILLAAGAAAALLRWRPALPAPAEAG